LPHRANGPGSAPRSGTGLETPRAPEEGKFQASHRDPGPLIGVRNLLTLFRTSHARRPNILPGGSGATTCSVGTGASSAGRLAHPPHSMWGVEACSAAVAHRADLVRPQCRPRFTEAHSEPPAPYPRRAVCRINWIRRHSSISSCLLRRKLRSPFSYVAGDAACYAWRRPDKTAPGHAKQGIPGAGKEIQERDPLRLRRHNI